MKKTAAVLLTFIFIFISLAFAVVRADGRVPVLFVEIFAV